MFNFVDPKFSPKVICKSPVTDNYEADNLISSDFMKKMRGFIAYTSMKPPVEVEFNFICRVNMHYIVLNTTVGNHKCSSIELYAKTDLLDYISIGKCTYNAEGVVFCNSRLYSKTRKPPNYKSTFELAFFKCDTFKYFLNATGIKVVILRTWRSVPCIRSVEVWGETSRTCSSVTKNTIKKIANRNHTEELPNSDSEKTEEFTIPEDFKDDLTYEIMSIPMTLPSGKTIDQRTLDRHIESEKSFGRKPCDPFTGIKFTDKLKPIINVGLKSRIDMFLLQNSHRPELSNSKRILGRANNIPEGNTSRKRNFEVVDNSDLDTAIANAKRSANFISFTSGESGDSDQKCSVCKTSNSLYKIPCDHLFCRVCLLNVSQKLACLICDKIIVRNDIQKVYF